MKQRVWTNRPSRHITLESISTSLIDPSLHRKPRESTTAGKSAKARSRLRRKNRPPAKSDGPGNRRCPNPPTPVGEATMPSGVCKPRRSGPHGRLVYRARGIKPGAKTATIYSLPAVPSAFTSISCFLPFLST